MCGIWALLGLTDEDVRKRCVECFKICHRGPDASRIETIPETPNSCLGFQRLRINGLLKGMQPMRLLVLPHIWLLYNGEIYNAFTLRDEYEFRFDTQCDGEIIIHLYERFGIETTARMLDGVFAFVVIDTKERLVHLGRDIFGVRPMFMFHDAGVLGACSEAKGLLDIANSRKAEIKPFPPGYIQTYQLDANGVVSSLVTDKVFLPIGGSDPTIVATLSSDKCANIRTLLKDAVGKRLMSDRRIGCLLSGGLDSSLVTALVVECMKENGHHYGLKGAPVQTFSIGMEGSPDVEYARKVAAHLGTEHYEVSFTVDEGFQAVRDVIYSLESYDITTVRASVGMYLVSKYIKEKTDTVVLFSGEGSDELCQGYIYFHKAPTLEEGDEESRRLLKDLYLYDNLRADRTTAAHGLELRVPFLDKFFTSYYLSLSPADRCPKDGCEKFLLRQSFSGTNLLPDDVLWRPKEAFSDGVSSKSMSWYELLQEKVKNMITDEMLANAKTRFPKGVVPKTKEGYYYRQIFEELYPNCAQLIPYYWMPKWTNATDPSARVLKHYK